MPAKPARTRKRSTSANTEPLNEAMVAETVSRALAERSAGATARDLAKAVNLTASTVTSALRALESAGAAARISARTKANPKTADVWTPAEPGKPTSPEKGPSENTREPTVATPQPPPREVSDPADATEPAADADTSTNPAPSGASGAAAPDEAASDAPTAEAVSQPVRPDHRVLGVATLLGEHPDGVTATDVAERSGLRNPVVARVLAAMEVAGAARRLPPDDSGTELWVRGDGDPAVVDVSQAPTHRTCPTCGHKTRISVHVGRSRSSPGVNNDGQHSLRKGELRAIVLDFVDRNPGQILTAGTIARELGRSPGAVRNNLDYLLAQGLVQHADDGDGKEVTALATKPEDL